MRPRRTRGSGEVVDGRAGVICRSAGSRWGPREPAKRRRRGSDSRARPWRGAAAAPASTAAGSRGGRPVLPVSADLDDARRRGRRHARGRRVGPGADLELEVRGRGPTAARRRRQRRRSAVGLGRIGPAPARSCWKRSSRAKATGQRPDFEEVVDLAAARDEAWTATREDDSAWTSAAAPPPARDGVLRRRPDRHRRERRVDDARRHRGGASGDARRRRRRRRRRRVVVSRRRHAAAAASGGGGPSPSRRRRGRRRGAARRRRGAGGRGRGPR